MQKSLAGLILALALTATAHSATLSHRYSYGTGSELVDSVGGNTGVLNNGATVSGGALQLSGAGSGTGGNHMGFTSSIDIGGNFGAAGASIEAWYTDSNTGTWGKLFHFGNSSAGQELAYTHTRGNGEQSGVDRNGTKLFGEQIAANTEHHLVITVAPDGTLNTWVDGDQKLSNVASNNLSNVTTTFEAVGATSWGDPGMSGEVEEFRIWQGELTAAEVAQSLAAGPDSLPGGGPIVTAFTASPSARQEGEASTLSWTIDTSDVTGTLSVQIRDPSSSVIHSSSSASSSFAVTIGDTAGSAQIFTYTIEAWDTDDPGNVRSSTTDIAVDPGIPGADDQTLQTVTTTPLGVTVTGSDPNTHPNATLIFSVVNPPASGGLTGTPPNLTYTANGGFTGSDSFTVESTDGKYDSPPATITIDVIPAPAAPTDIVISTTNIGENVTSGGFIASLLSTDANAEDTHSYSLVAGAGSNDNASFSIVGNQLRAAIDFAGQVGNTFAIRLHTLDSSGRSFQKAFVLTVVEASTDIVINEIHFNPPYNPVRQEFVELYNPTNDPVDIAGWRLSGAIAYVFPSGTTLDADGYIVVAEDPATLQSTLNATALGPFSGNLSSSGETIRLRDANDAVIDDVDFKVGFPWPVASDGGGASIELINPSLDNSLGSSWRASFPQTAFPPATLLDLADDGWSWRPGTSEASAPIDAWREQSFVEDATWQPVQTPIGYGPVNGVFLNTTITGMQNNYRCVFLRNTFSIAPGEIPSQLLLNYIADDALLVWINGVEVERKRIDADPPTINDDADNTPDEGATESKTATNPGAFLVEGTNTIAVQVYNGTLTSTDLGFDLEIVRPGEDASSAVPTPGSQNSAFATNAAPNIRKVDHTPAQATAADTVAITAQVTDPESVASVTLEYQSNAPGNYIPSKLPLPISGGNINTALPRPDNPAYESGWTSVTMVDDGTGGDALAGDDLFTATIPHQPHRSLVRYRITVEDGLAKSARVPYSDDLSLNFAYFVYDGVPAYEGTDAATMATALPVYHLITRADDYAECYGYSSSDQINQFTEARFFYNWTGTIVYDGTVHDNVRYRLRGANGRYQGGGKRSMRIRFNDGDYLEAHDQFGKKYRQPWRTLTLGKGQSNRSTQTFGLNEAVNYYLTQQLGVPAANPLYIQWRVVDDADEAPDQWRGDFNGFHFVSETYDVRFLEEHGLAKGNLYKLINQTSDWLKQQRYQYAFAPSDGSDHNWIEGQLDGGDDAATISANVRLDKWFTWHAYVEATRHYDYWPSANKNMVYYFEPDYLPANDNRGKLWILPWDTDSSWGPSYNSGHDVVYNSIFNASGGGSDNNTTPELWPGYYNAVRELRDLLWQPDQIEPVIDEFADFLAPIEAADAARWKGAPGDAGNYNHLSGPGQTSLAAYAQDMKNFAFTGGSWPGGNDGVIPQSDDSGTSGQQGRDAYLDFLQGNNGEGALIPDTPIINYTGPLAHPTNGLSFQSSAFSDPQGNGSFGAMEWRIAQITDPSAPGYDPNERFKLEIESDWESGELTSFSNTISPPTIATRSDLTYRARVRHQDNTGRWSHWSIPVEFTASLPDISDYLAGLVVTEVMYHPADPDAAEITAGFDDDDFFEYIELKNVGSTTLDLTDLRFTKGIDFDFLGAAITSLAPGEIVLVVNNQTAFEMRYSAGLPIAGEWQSTDKLDNGGEQLKLSFGAGDAIRDFIYDDKAPWPTAPDGSGASLTLVDPDSVPNHALPASWRPSFATAGTPGTDETGQNYTTWRDALFGAGSPLGSAELDDPDLDGVTNLIEFALGTDPLSGASQPTLEPSSVAIADTEYFSVRYTHPADRTGVTVLIEFSTDLEHWNSGDGFTADVATIDNGDGTSTVKIRSVTPLSTDLRQYLRLAVVQ